MEAGLAGLTQEAMNYKANAFATSTKAAYRTHLQTYLRFCIYYGLEPVPADKQTLTCYVAHLARTMAPQSIEIYLNIIRILHEEAGLPNPLVANYEVRMVKRGVAREKGKPAKQKAPITVAILTELYATLDLTKPPDVAFWAAVLVGFFGYLRKSSLLPAQINTPKAKRLSRADVTDTRLDSFILTCKHSKSNQFGQRVHTIPYASCPDHRLCPVKAIYTHLSMSVLHQDSPLFNFVENGAQRFMSHPYFVKRLKLGIQLISRDASLISAHSLRRGGATLSFLCNVPAEQIKARGDWASDCYQRYIEISPEANMNVARALGTAAAARPNDHPARPPPVGIST
jgi:hypothetical protein